MPTISVIVPVFNAEDTLERCVGSILAQTHTNLDIILVDDGSTDISGEMCDTYERFDSRVRAFHTPNRGLSAARNLGIEHAALSGSQFIAFADADDWLESRMFEELLAALDSTNADIAFCGFRVDGIRTKSDFVPDASEYDKRTAISALISGGINNGVWNKLYRSYIFDEIRFPEGRVYEDISTMHRILLLCRKLISIPYIGYHYVLNERGITHTTTMGNLIDFWTAYKERREYLIAKAPDYLGEEQRSGLALGVAHAVSRTWRWSYGNGPQEIIKHASVLREMQEFVRKDLKNIDKSEWPFSLKAPLVLSRSNSTVSFAASYYANQIFISLLPKKSGSRK